VGDPERAGRATLVRALREAGVDVVFAGHVAVIEPGDRGAQGHTP
jgi:hypothetical protein